MVSNSFCHRVKALDNTPDHGRCLGEQASSGDVSSPIAFFFSNCSITRASNHIHLGISNMRNRFSCYIVQTCNQVTNISHEYITKLWPRHDGRLTKGETVMKHAMISQQSAAGAWSRQQRGR